MDDLDSWIADLTRAELTAHTAAAKVVSKGALNIKRDAAHRISGHPHLPAYPSSITYDLTETRDVIHARIGPDKARVLRVDRRFVAREGPLAAKCCVGHHRRSVG